MADWGGFNSHQATKGIPQGLKPPSCAFMRDPSRPKAEALGYLEARADTDGAKADTDASVVEKGLKDRDGSKFIGVLRLRVTVNRDASLRMTASYLRSNSILLSLRMTASYLRSNSILLSLRRTASYFRSNSILLSLRMTAPYFRSNSILLSLEQHLAFTSG